MNTNTIETQETSQAEASQPKRKGPAVKAARSAKKSGRSKKAAGKPTAESNEQKG